MHTHTNTITTKQKKQTCIHTNKNTVNKPIPKSVEYLKFGLKSDEVNFSNFVNWDQYLFVETFLEVCSTIVARFVFRTFRRYQESVSGRKNKDDAWNDCLTDILRW